MLSILLASFVFSVIVILKSYVLHQATWSLLILREHERPDHFICYINDVTWFAQKNTTHVAAPLWTDGLLAPCSVCCDKKTKVTSRLQRETLAQVSLSWIFHIINWLWLGVNWSLTGFYVWQ